MFLKQVSLILKKTKTKQNKLNDLTFKNERKKRDSIKCVLADPPGSVLAQRFGVHGR